MAKQWTPGQRQAINDDFTGNALVSASAGSGKTSVLTQRVMRKVRDGIDVDKLLIVTFTNDAAKEMRDRINAALKDAVNNAKDTDEKRYYLKQIRKLTTAHIETMDAFCQWLVKKYYYVIDLDPDFRILTDKSELGILRDNVWSKLREDLYANDSDGSFAKLTRNFSNDRSDDGLTDILMSLYDFANVNEDPEQWLQKLPDFYDINGNLTESPLYKKYLLPIFNNKLEQTINDWKQMQQQANSNGIDKLTTFLGNEIDQFKALKNKFNELSWDEIRNQLDSFKLKKLPSITKKDYEADQLAVKDKIRNNRTADKTVKKITDNYFFANETDNINIIEASQKIINKLVSVVKLFSKAYMEAKQKRHAYEFIDIEHFALNILNNDSETAQDIRHQFQNYINEIMVDEYQDNNHLQDAILNSIKNKNHENMFMVGDVKQSIYRFRLADPSMFMQKYENYPEVSNDNTRITLPDNFRSVKNVDDFTNLIFSQIMNKQLGEIDYTGDANLKFGAKDYPDDLDTKTEIILYSDDVENADEPLDNKQQQVEMVAEKIDKLMKDHFQVYDRKQQAKRDIQYGDIAILAGTKQNNFDIANTFADHQIPVEMDGSESYFKTTEVQIMLSLLQIIDNAYQDIPLVAVLRSPIVGMNENQLAYLRITKKMGNYFQSVLDFKNNYGSHATTPFSDEVAKKVDIFLKQLKSFKDYAVNHSLAELIWYIYQETGFLDYVGGMPAGKKRQANLHALYQRAEEYERNGFKGLFAFVQFVKRLQNRDEDLAQASANVNPNAVSVKTIHGSKGLEFPVVFLLDTNHQFNESDLKNDYIFDDNLGIGIKYLDVKNHVKFPTLQLLAIKNLAQKRSLAEEMRKLYVALTRAKQKLIITGIVKHKRGKSAAETAIDTWNKAEQSNDLVLNESLRNSAKTFLDWIGMSLARHKQFNQSLDEYLKEPNDTQSLSGNTTQFEIKFLTADDLNTQALVPTKQNNIAETDDAGTDAEFIKKIMNFKYQYPDATKTTAYQSVSEIKRQFDDPDNIQLGSVAETRNQILKNTRYNNDTFAEPKFLQTVTAPSATDIGTATHLVLQKLNVYERVNSENISKLVKQLVEEKLLSAEVAKKINVNAIIAFFKTDLGKRILLYPEKLHREVPFSMIINASELFSEFKNDSQQKLLVHGIIDGYLDDPEKGAILFDYKTSYVNPNNPDKSIAKIKQQYAGQLNIYAMALQDILQKPIFKKYLYLLANNSLLEIK